MKRYAHSRSIVLISALGLCRSSRVSTVGIATLDSELGADAAPAVRVVGLGIVGEDALDDDSLLAIPGSRADEEGRAGEAVPAEQLGVREPRVIIDRYVQPVPASPAALGRIGAATMRLPTVQKRPSFLVSTCRSSPAVARLIAHA